MRNRTNTRHDHRRFARATRGGTWDPGSDHGHGSDRGHGSDDGRGSDRGHGGDRGRDHGHGRMHDGHMRDGGRHGGRRGRVFDHGDLRLVVLQLIAEKPRHGYEIIKAIEERVGGAYSPSPGVVYPTLTMLEELGHVTVTEQDGKKLQTLTDAGRAYLAENRDVVEALQARMARVAAASRAEDPPPSVIRATENLKLALRLKLHQGHLTYDQARTIAATLDAAAAAVEQA
jgi:DNA-binding PadR family transcriptional regulator